MLGSCWDTSTSVVVAVESDAGVAMLVLFVAGVVGGIVVVAAVAVLLVVEVESEVRAVTLVLVVVASLASAEVSSRSSLSCSWSRSSPTQGL